MRKSLEGLTLLHTENYLFEGGFARNIPPLISVLRPFPFQVLPQGLLHGEPPRGHPRPGGPLPPHRLAADRQEVGGAALSDGGALQAAGQLAAVGAAAAAAAAGGDVADGRRSDREGLGHGAQLVSRSHG